LESKPTPSRTGTLEERLAEAWELLDNAVHEPGEDWHLPSIATVDLDDLPRSRTVVLRGFDRDRRELLIHTDFRSPKCREIEKNPRVSWLFYDRGRKLQLRVRTMAMLQAKSPRADTAWARATASSRRAYLAPFVPSSPIDTWHPNIPEEFQRTVPPIEATEVGRENFALIVCRIEEIDRLDLGYDGHRRSRWRWDKNEHQTSEWLAA
jgi:3-hydroxyisobutyrate dehydrogenase